MKNLCDGIIFFLQGCFSSLHYSLYSRNKHLDMHFLNILLQIEVNYDDLSENRTTPM